MLGLEFKSGNEDFSLQSLYLRLFEKGLIVGYKPAANLFRFYPPLTIGEEDVARLVERLEKTLKNQ